MSHTRLIIVSCDNVTKDVQCFAVWVEEGSDPVFTVANVRSRARKAGWKLLRHVENSPVDLCPEHEMFEGVNPPPIQPLGVSTICCGGAGCKLCYREPV